MIITFSVGSRCAVMLPRKFINPQLTPAKGLVINRLLGSKHLILVEEVWQFKGLQHSPLEEMCMPSGRIRSNNWGWREVPELLDNDEYIIVPAEPHNLMEITSASLESMIKKSVVDFKKVHGFI